MTIRAIRKFLDNPDAVIFVGAGISRWSGLPSWEGLIGKLAEYLEEAGKDASLVRREARTGDLLQAASYGFDRLGPQAMGEFIRDVTMLGSAKPSIVHRALVTLGPTCFITTNYDNLIEQALSFWLPEEFFRPPVTNVQLASLAEILSARASNFIFKPHGDASDSASIILTREQYRVLMPGGERNSALEALKTLLVTRPVFYVGFGLRDPDFLYIKDILLNIYKGTTQEHIAIVANVDQSEHDYWDKNYGIRLLSYDAPRNEAGDEDHSALLVLLESLKPEPVNPTANQDKGKNETPSDEHRTLALARYAAGLSRLFPNVELVDIRISHHGEQNSRGAFFHDPYEYWTASRFLSEGPSQAIIVGLPGSGKSFSFRATASSLAKLLQDYILGDGGHRAPIYMPVLVDLKLYQGDLYSQILASLPPGFTLKTLKGSLKTKIFFDAYNEMPSEYIESGSFIDDIANLSDQIGEYSFVISSRTTDGLNQLALPTYELSEFDNIHVERVLTDKGVFLRGEFKEDVQSLLSRPFFLGLLKAEKISISDGSRPRDIYESYISKLDREWAERSSLSLPLSKHLSRLAFRALDDGREAFPSEWVHDHLLSDSNNSHINTLDILNWLISKGVLVPYSGARMSFIHQSVTEYLAALELVRINRNGDLLLKEIVEKKKWDQCLFLAISLMDDDEAEAAMSYLINTDISLALSAVRFAEEAQEELISRVTSALRERAARDRDDHANSYPMSRVPFTLRHVEDLEAIASYGGAWGVQAIRVLGRIPRDGRKEYLFSLLEGNPYDYNATVNGLAEALGPLLNESDIDRFVTLLGRSLQSERKVTKIENEIEASEKRKLYIGPLLANFDPDLVISKLESYYDGVVPDEAFAVVCDSLRERDDRRSFEIALDLLERGVREAVYSLYFRIRFDDVDHCIDAIEEKHVEAIWRCRFGDSFGVELLHVVIERRNDLKSVPEAWLRNTTGIERIALMSCLGADQDVLFKELSELVALPDDALVKENFGLFRIDELNWEGNEQLFGEMLCRRNGPLTKSMLGSGTPCDVKGLGRIAEEHCEAALIWLSELVADDDDNNWDAQQIGSLIARHGGDFIKRHVIEALDMGPSPTREAARFAVLPYMNDMSTDHLGVNAISLFMSELAQPRAISPYFYNPLGQLATERFVEERLLPLSRNAEEAFQRNLRLVLSAAGDRHGRRYALAMD
ncbi:SIR2 family protein [Microcoleus sp. LEGE 07076]|uniref:SIR2 family protein n=1 Tax=Microcoleus sp. LEGE 07076 TaxID=915322 RepID=UPI00187E108B|nr:SIR2 family protein [Microcoleus sp. LEGE 07076]MBE9188307.1 SIR2 family protein [Microcoleus sp. LEGE 07076]